jgi:serine/threonine protein kinase
LKELVKGLLDKDPAKRILWEELIDHPYWQEYDIKELKASNFPSEPQFEAYLQKLGKSKRTPISRKKKQEKQ